MAPATNRATDAPRAIARSSQHRPPGTGSIVDETGITRNVKGEGPFHDMSVRCLFHWSVVEGTNHLTGSCVETDKDGDNVFTTFDDKNHYLMGGTGKYKGITGTG